MKKQNVLSEEKLQHMNQKLKQILRNPSSEKKQFSFNVKPSLIVQMDQFANIISDISERPYTRNSLVEDAIEVYLKELNTYLQKKYPEKFCTSKQEEVFDTVIYPSNEIGYYEVFLKDKEWYFVRIQKEKVDKIKYIALYVKKPIGKVLTYGKVDRIIYSEENQKYIIQLKSIHSLENSIGIGNLSPAVTRSPKDTTLEKLLKAKTYADL